MKFLRFKTTDGDRLVRLEHIVECLPMVAIESDHSGSDPRYRGLLHYRGRVLPVFEPVGRDRQPLAPDWFLIVAEDDDCELALIARDVDDIESRPADDCRNLEVGDGNQVTVVGFDDEIVRVLEPSALLDN